MKNLKLRIKSSFILVPLMTLYVFIPCMSQATPVTYASSSVSQHSTFNIQHSTFNIQHSTFNIQHSTFNIQPTATLTYFYNGSTLMNGEDDNGDMSTYLDRTVRTIVNVNTQTVLDTQCLFTDGKNVISQIDSTGTSVTSTQQYNAFGQPVNYNLSSTHPTSNIQNLTLSTNPFAYDGYYYDQESSLYYLNARYYSPTVMQFISMDSYDLANRYAYCDGNPIGNEDPTGHLSTDQDIGIAFAAVATIFVMVQPIAALAAYSYLASTFTKGKLSKGLAIGSYVLAGVQGLGDVGVGLYSFSKKVTIPILTEQKLNEIMKPENLLGSGNYGDAYKYQAEDGTFRVAKVFKDKSGSIIKRNYTNQQLAVRNEKVWNDVYRKLGFKNEATAKAYRFGTTDILDMPFIDGEPIEIGFGVDSKERAIVDKFFVEKIGRFLQDAHVRGNVVKVNIDGKIAYKPVDIDQMVTNPHDLNASFFTTEFAEKTKYARQLFAG